MLYKLIKKWWNSPSKKNLKNYLKKTTDDYEILLNVHRKERIELFDENTELKKSMQQVISNIDTYIEEYNEIKNENKKLKEKAEMLSEWNGELIKRVEIRYSRIEISEMDKERYYRLKKNKEDKEKNNG